MNIINKSSNNNDSIIIEIQNEYKKINNKWLNLHYYTCIGFILFGLFIECVLGITLYTSGHMEIPLAKYALKYILVPILTNVFLVLSGILVMHSAHLQQKTKVYTISLLLVGVCFVFFSVHSVFDSLYLIFTAPILLTVVYSQYALTTVTAFASIAAKIISEVFIFWDPGKVNPFATSTSLINFFISIAILCAFYVVCMIVIRFQNEKNAASIQKEVERYEMKHRLITDDLTEICNKSALSDAFQKIEKDDTGNIYALAMIDLDNFKTLNDTLGHDKGDQCLREFGHILSKNCPLDVTPFRFGGDEFCIIFQNKTLGRILQICKSIQNDLKKCTMKHENIVLTASIGIAYYAQPMSTKQLLQNTDFALYRSKGLKNAICVYDDKHQFDTFVGVDFTHAL